MHILVQQTYVFSLILKRLLPLANFKEENMYYYVRKTYLQPLSLQPRKKNDLLKYFAPQTHASSKYKNWTATLDLKTCLECKSTHGKIYLLNETVFPEPPLHPRCRCKIEKLKAIYAGEATTKSKNGADWWIKNFGELPNYYISINEAKKAGYKSYLGNLSIVAPDKMLTKGQYANRNGHLPSAPGKIWYEADINYNSGYRGVDRILFSNDGLIFVTYDHYQTFQAIE